MKVSASIELTWQLAGQEAIVAKCKEIKAEHFLSALLKLSELPLEDVNKIAPDAKVVKQLAVEVDCVRDELERRAIDSRQVRHQLRAEMGEGNRKYEGGQMHRSQASREMFDSAARLADEAGQEVLTPLHLLVAILESPTSAMEKVLRDKAGPKPVKSSKTPLLDEFGRDLTLMAAKGQLDSGNERITESKALIHALSQGKSKSMLLITDDEPAAMSVVSGAARTLTTKNVPKILKGKSIIDLRTVKPLGKDASKNMEKLEKLFLEAAISKAVILVVPPIAERSNAKQTSKWFDLLKTTLEHSTVQCICRVSNASYHNWIEKDRTWRRITNFMHIQNKTVRDVPWEL